MILVVVALFMTLMVSTGCKKKFDIQGSWELNFNWSAVANVANSSTELSAKSGFGASGTITLVFSGDKKSGIFTSLGIPSGTYSVDGKSVVFTWDNGTTYVGTSSDDNNMSGTMLSIYGGGGTWSAIR